MKLGTVTFSRKGCLKSVPPLSISQTWEKLCQSVKLYNKYLWHEIFLRSCTCASSFVFEKKNQKKQQVFLKEIFFIFRKKHVQYLKSVLTRSYPGQHFPALGLNTEKYGVSLRIQSECGKTRTRITSNRDTFYAVVLTKGIAWKYVKNYWLQKLFSIQTFCMEKKLHNIFWNTNTTDIINPFWWALTKFYQGK